MEGTPLASADAVRLAVYWGDVLLNVSQVKDPRLLTAGDVFGHGVTAAGVSPQLRLFSDEIHDKARLQLGPLTLVAEPVDPPRLVPRLSMPEDWSFFKVAAMTALMMVAVLVSIAITPQDMPSTSDDIIGDTARIIKTQITKPKPLPPKLAAALERAKGLEGQAGSKKAPKDQSPDKTKLARKKDVRDFGLLAVTKGGGLDKILNSATNTAIENGLVGLKNDARSIGDARGMGMGARHNNDGGGGTEWTQIGGVGTKKTGRPDGTLKFGAGTKVAIIPPSSPKEIIGGLSKEEIARVVRRHQSEIKYCYETELQKDPGLKGKVSVWWEIDPVGGVSEAKVADSSLNNATAENCMLTKIRKWRFPEPVGGGVVSVTFPWVFTSAGSTDE